MKRGFGPQSQSIVVRGVTYHVVAAGAGSPLLLLHGFTGSTSTWTTFLPAFAEHHRVIAVDLLGHGGSDIPQHPTRYGVEETAKDLLALLDHLAPSQRFAVLSYSMGGRVALHLALKARERVHAIVLEGASPGIADAQERKARVQSDSDLAAYIEQEGVEKFVDRWQSLPLFATQSALPESIRQQLRRQRLANSPRGLANSLRGMGAGAMQPLHHQLHKIAAPVLLLVGELDQNYRRLALEMESLLPQAQVAIVPGAGHAVHVEQPTQFETHVLAFLGATAAPSSCIGGSS